MGGPRVCMEVLWKRKPLSPSGNRKPDHNTKMYLAYIRCVDGQCTEMVQGRRAQLSVIIRVYTYIRKKERKKERKEEEKIKRIKRGR